MACNITDNWPQHVAPAGWFHYILIALKWAYNGKKLFKTSYYWSRDTLNFDFLDKGLGIVLTAHFVYDFSTKMFLMLYSIKYLENEKSV